MVNLYPKSINEVLEYHLVLVIHPTNYWLIHLGIKKKIQYNNLDQIVRESQFLQFFNFHPVSEVLGGWSIHTNWIKLLGEP